jgi:hypothetical protein
MDTVPGEVTLKSELAPLHSDVLLLRRHVTLLLESPQGKEPPGGFLC